MIAKRVVLLNMSKSTNERVKNEYIFTFYFTSF